MNNRILKIAVASGKGGTGKTTIASNLASTLAGYGYDAAYVDCDVEEPNGHLFFKPEYRKSEDVTVKIPEVDYSRCNFCGLCSEICQFNALAILIDKVMIFPSQCHSCGGCYYVCPEQAIREIERPIGTIGTGHGLGVQFLEGRLNVGEAISPPITKILRKKMPESGIVVIDAPPGTSCPVIEAVKDTDFVILVTEPTPFGLNDLTLAVEMVRALHLNFGVVINRCDVGDNRIEEYCRRENIDILIKLPFDRKISFGCSKGEMISRKNTDFGEKLFMVYENIKDRTGNV